MRGSVGGAGAGGRVDATQEMVTLGLCNMAGSLVHAMPTCGAFTRSAVSHSSGVRTPAAGAYSGAHSHTSYSPNPPRDAYLAYSYSR